MNQKEFSPLLLNNYISSGSFSIWVSLGEILVYLRHMSSSASQSHALISGPSRKRPASEEVRAEGRCS